MYGNDAMKTKEIGQVSSKNANVRKTFKLFNNGVKCSEYVSTF